MNKVHIFLTVSAVIIAVLGCGGGRSGSQVEADAEGVMTLSTSDCEVELDLQGSGTVTVNWGDSEDDTPKTVKYYHFNFDREYGETHFVFFDDGTAFICQGFDCEFNLEEYIQTDRRWLEFETWLFLESGATSEMEFEKFNDAGRICEGWIIFDYKTVNFFPFAEMFQKFIEWKGADEYQRDLEHGTSKIVNALLLNNEYTIKFVDDDGIDFEIRYNLLHEENKITRWYCWQNCDVKEYKFSSFVDNTFSLIISHYGVMETKSHISDTAYIYDPQTGIFSFVEG